VNCVDAHHIRRRSGRRPILDGITLQIDHGRVVGLVGANGAGKSALLHAVGGFVPVEGDLHVLGVNPWAERAHVMRSTAFIGDASAMPGWMRVSQALEYVAGVHPSFDLQQAKALLEPTGISFENRIGTLSNGMIAQLQLALAMAIHAQLFLLDEPIAGVDAGSRKRFFDALLAAYATEQPTILLATHDLDEIQHVLTDLVFLDHGRVAFQCTMDEYEDRFVEVHVHPEHIDIARDMRPLAERPGLGGSMLLFDNGDRRRLSLFGDLCRPRIADLFEALVSK
jgi:ABC-2 type transport system ATP-binding protein